MMTLGELTRTIEQDARNRNAWPSGPSSAGIAYAYAYGKVAGELESKWQWDAPRERTRFYRQGLQKAVTYLIRTYILTRIVGPLRAVGQDIPVLPGKYAGSDLRSALVYLSDLSAMLNSPVQFFKAIQVICTQCNLKYPAAIFDAAAAPVAVTPAPEVAAPSGGQP